MNYEDANQVIRDRFTTQVHSVLEYPTQHDNGIFVDMSGSEVDQPTDAPWMSTAVLHGASFQTQFGQSKRFRRPGVLMVSLLFPLEEGDAGAIQAADTVVGAFLAVTDGGVTFQSPYPSSPSQVSVAGADGREGKWWRVSVTCPFFFDHTT